MKLTIVADDGAVGIDGIFFSNLDLSSLDPSIHAVQWYGEYGEIEYKTKFENGVVFKPENKVITDISSYLFATFLWQTAKEKEEAEEVAQQMQMENLNAA